MEKKSKEVKKEPKKKAAAAKPEKYVFAIGRRKRAQSKVKLFMSGKGDIAVNTRAFGHYFPNLGLQKMVLDPLTTLGLEKKVNITVSTDGGGVAAQAKATSLAISRALIKADPNFRPALKKLGFLTRDAREKERKKPGLKRARRAPQWQKR